jgi:processive 1,2-diacylglycerol beta-glucosyltransferase
MSAHMRGKILILSAGYGEGHNAAARGVRDALRQMAPEVETHYLDLFSLVYRRANEVAQKAYLAAINRAPRLWEAVYKLVDSTSVAEKYLSSLTTARSKLLKVIAEQQPAAIVSTYPAYGYLLSSGEPPCPFITIVTDSITVNSIWYRASSDYFIVPNEQTGTVLRKAGIDAGKIAVLGFPVNPLFTSPHERPLPSVANGRKILYMINFGKKEAPDLVSNLLELPDIELTVTTGRDIELQRRIEAVARERGQSIEIYGWTNQLPQLLMRTHLLISKAGGATVQETIAARTPMIISQVVPGQEEGNARLILENDCGCLGENHDDIIAAVQNAFDDDAALWRRWETNITRLSRPDAAFRIAEFVLSKAKEGV